HPARLPLPLRLLRRPPGLQLEVRRRAGEGSPPPGPDNVAAFIAEPVVGAALAAVPAPDGYFQRIREICTKYDVLFIADEVMTGFGRTGRWFACEHWGVVPDIMTAAKGVSGGYAPLAVLLATDEVVGALDEAGTPFVAGHTF